MDTSGFKNIIQKLSVFKDYSALLVPVVIVLIAVVLFVLGQLMGSKLKKQIVNESILKRGNKVKTLSENVKPADQWKEEEKYQLAFESDVKRVADLATQSTQRQLLSYKIFPEPKDTSTLIFEEFGQRFRNSVDKLMARINARDCPTDAELDRALRRSGSKTRSRRGGKKLYGKLNEYEATITDVLCQEKAESASVYANSADLSGYEFWGEWKYTNWEKAVEDCWYWQLAYWVIEDVIDTIDALNSGSNSVFTSPIKRILAVSFTRSDRQSKGKVADERCSYVLSIEDGLTESCTGRFSNDDIDVVHFNVVMAVSTKAVLPFMQQLCSAKQHKFSGVFGKAQEQVFKHNQIAILESEIASIDREDETHRLYRYGEDAVVELDLICEYIFNKNGYDEVKPESVKESLKKPEEQKARAKGKVSTKEKTTEPWPQID